MFKKIIIRLGKYRFLGFKIKLPKANLVLITAKKGYIMCGYLNLKIANKLNQAACLVTGVSSPPEMLSKKIENLSKSARILGIRKSMSVKEALIKLS